MRSVSSLDPGELVLGLGDLGVATFGLAARLLLREPEAVLLVALGGEELRDRLGAPA